jgi:hypothetical protein
VITTSGMILYDFLASIIWEYKHLYPFGMAWEDALHMGTAPFTGVGVKIKSIGVIDVHELTMYFERLSLYN